MGAKNAVIAGDYQGKNVIKVFNSIQIATSMTGGVELDKFAVEAYEVVDEAQRKSASSGIARGAIGAALLGPVGLLAGVSAKNKGVYIVALRFKDGKNSLIEIDDKMYKVLIQTMF